MKNKLHYSPDALRDLDEIWEYIQMELSNPSAAANVVNGILDTLDRLEDFAEWCSSRGLGVCHNKRFSLVGGTPSR